MKFCFIRDWFTLEDSHRMRITLCLVLKLTVLFSVSSQTLTVIDASTELPINGVFVYHEDQAFFGQTNTNGKLELIAFPIGTLFFQHPSYYEKNVVFSGEDLVVQLEERIISFNEVVVSANKWEQDEENLPQQILSVDKKTIAFENPQTSADLLAQSGQVFVQKSQLGGGSPKLRGFAANSVLLVVDGVRMNNAIFRGGNLQNVINIDPNAIESTEVVFGPGSVIYGSDALGGVMDFHTIQPSFSSDGQATVDGNALLRYSSAANEKTGHLDFSIARPTLTFFHSSSYTDFEDLRAGDRRSEDYRGEFERLFYVDQVDGQDQLINNSDVNLQRFSGYQLFNTISKLRWRANANTDLSYGFYFSTTSDIPRYDRLTESLNGNPDSLAVAEWYYGPQEWQMHQLRMDNYVPTKLYDQLRVIAAYQQFEESRNDRDFGDHRLRTRTETVNMYSLTLDLDKMLPKGNLFYGIDFYHNDVSSGAFRKDLITGSLSSTSTRYPDGGSDYTSYALYGSWIHKPIEKLTLNAGLRYNVVSLNATTNDSLAQALGNAEIDLMNSAFNGSFGIVFKPAPASKLGYNLSSGFRAPNVDDVGKIFDLNEEVTIVPNPDLKPEHSINNELSFEWKSKRTYLEIVGYYTRLFDAIVRGPINDGLRLPNGSEARAQINAGKAEIYGGSLIIRTEIDKHWALTSSFSWTEGEDLTNNQPLRHATPLFGRTSVIYKKNKLKGQFYLEYNSSRNPGQIPDTEFIDKAYLYTANGSPGWMTFNLKSSYQFNQHFNFSFGIENILDQHYRPYTSGISAPGRNFIISLRSTI
jgi:hemoglobin/transferrin/lactoferrin receptor protein